jgi:hydrogenase nickel incorporation protein HypB
MRRVTVVQNILKANDAIAAENRQAFDDNGVMAMNWLSSPGAGKTTLLEKTLPALADLGVRAAVIEGDIQTTRDAERIDAVGVQAVQVTTGGTCHLDASMVKQALAELPLSDLDLVIIENVGNLVCPAGFFLGEHIVTTLLSVTEGHDKPLKYPQAFRAAQTMVITKLDLVPYTNFDLEEGKEFALRINPDLHIVETSATTGDGINEWADWIKKSCDEKSTGERS